MTPLCTRPLKLAVTALALATAAVGQVHYHKDGRPWKQRARSGPDAEVPGWFYNLGVTGLRVELVEDDPTHLVVRHIFEGTPADRRIQVGDHIVGAAGRKFVTPHRNGYGMKVFGPTGPILDFANALEKAQGASGSQKGKLDLRVLRDGEAKDVTLKLGSRHGSYSRTFPDGCKKTDRILKQLLDDLVEAQRDDGSWGSPPRNLFAPLALLAHGEAKYRTALNKAARFHARTTTNARKRGGLINWRYMAAGIFLSEYYLATKKQWVLPELQEIYEFIVWSQYTDMAQINPKARETHPGAVPKGPDKAFGGWGHNPGFEGYGPIAMITGQGALTLALMAHCGIEVDRARLDAAYDFLQRGTGRNGYVWYGDEVAGHDRYADMGRTGAAGIAHWLAPYQDGKYRKHAKLNASCIAAHPESFPDTHGSPIMGMVYAAMAANAADPKGFRKLMDANRWWFTLSRCADGTFYYQPNRDNAGYGGDSRIKAMAATALIFSLPKRTLHVSGKPF